MRLEPLLAAHADELFPQLSDAGVWTYTDDVAPATLEALRARYRGLESRRSPDGAEGWLNWAVLVDGHAIGFVQATVRAGAPIDIAYALGRAHWSRGHATDAVATMLRFLRRRFTGARFAATVDARNLASRRLLERAGLQLGDDADARNLRYDSP